MKIHLYIALCILFAMRSGLVFSQDPTGQPDKFSTPSGNLFNKTDQKARRLDRQLTRQAEKYLGKLSGQETLLKNKLSQKDPVAASNAFPTQPATVYQRLSTVLRSDSIAKAKPAANGTAYLPYVDSLQGSLNFLKKNPQLLSSVKQSAGVETALASLQSLRSRMQYADQIKQYVEQRKQQLRATIAQYADNSALKKYYDSYSQTAYYYSEQIRSYKAVLNDPDKLLQKTLTALNQLPAFRDFMVKNSLIAGLFNIPADNGSASAIEGLQTRDKVQAFIQEQVSAGGPGAMEKLQQNLSDAHGQLDQLKSKLASAGGSGGDMDMPDFKPNGQKTKTFWKRLEYGFNFQTARSDNFFPATTDIGLSLGYRLNEKSTVGIGASYKLGWGQNINHVRFSNEGLGLRSFLDLKIKGNWFASGGFEYNYQQPIASTGMAPDLPNWSQSGLIGITKELPMKGKMARKTKIQLLWDFLSYSQRPQSQPIKFRVGYNF